MKIKIEFDAPEENELLEDYQKGLKLLYFMHQWIQEAKWKVEDGKMSGSDLLQDLKDELNNENIELL